MKKEDEFQSPSLRGSGRFPAPLLGGWASPEGFNPLHCGAVVASGPARRFWPSAWRVSIPFIAGQWSLPMLAVWRAWREGEVSIPFIAGQWSLHVDDMVAGLARALFQSPSLRGSGRFLEALARLRADAESFNPLHCGAVVTSSRRTAGGARRNQVSIPFIAGQWSLPLALVAAAALATVSIPFIAGQWSLRAIGREG